MEHIPWSPIGYMKTCFKSKNGTPRQPSISPDSGGVLTIYKSIFTNPEHSLEGLGDYTFVWILFSFHLNENKGVKAKVRPPRLGGAKLGIFATRSPHRPNPIGLTLARLERVSGATITLSGLDIVDGTPILDIKPYIPWYDTPKSGTTRTGCESQAESQDTNDQLTAADHTCSEDNAHPTIVKVSNTNSDLKTPPWTQSSTLNVVFTTRAKNNLAQFNSDLETDKEYGASLEFIPNSNALHQAIADVLRADPRSTYRRNKCSDRLYFFTLDSCHITAWFDHSTTPATAEVLRIKPEGRIKEILS